MSKICIKCGTVLEDDALFCSECGTKQEPVEKKCPNCGAVIKEGAKFCMNCGVPVNAAAAAKAATQPQKQASTDFEVSQPDADTLSFNIKGVPFNMKLIRGGMIGQTELSDFYIGETVVTQSLWQTVMGDNPSKDNSDLQYPVTDFNKQLTKNLFIRLKKITGVEFAIPTSSQLKYVALKGCENMGEETFGETTWGDAKIHPVCGMMSNALGLYDLSEWYQLVVDQLPEGDYYRFNPLKESGDGFAERQKSPKEVELIPLPVLTLTLRLVINIPVSPEIEKAKKKLENTAMESFDETVLFRIIRNGKYGYINKKGQVIISCKYDYAGVFSEGLARVKINDSYGYIDVTGKIIIKTVFDSKSDDFHEEFARVRVKEKYGYINKTGQTVIPCEFDDARNFSEGLARVKKKGLFGYINTAGEIVIPCKYERAGNFHEGISWVMGEDDDYYTYIDKGGKEIFTYELDEDEEPSNFREGLLCVCIDDEDDEFYGYINRDGERVIEIDSDDYDEIGGFHEGLAFVRDCDEEKYGYINKNGKLVIKCKYDGANGFCEDLASVKENRKWGFIDRSGKKVIPCKYEKVEDFKNGLARVTINGKKGYVDKTGREVGFE